MQASGIRIVRDPNGVGYDAVYDELGRMTAQTDTFGDSTSMTYDKGGNVKTRTDAKGIVTTMVYDAQNRLTSTTDRLGGVTLNNYNCCRLASLVDAEGQVTSYTYIARGERISETFPDHVTGSNPGDTTYGIVAFEYDPAGRLLRKTDQLGDTITFNYDLAGRMHQRDYRTLANSPSGTIADSDSFTFDGAGRMLTAVSGRYANTVAQTYDFMGRLLTESLTIAGRTYTITHAYDSFGRPAQMTYPNGSVSERTFTPRGQLHEVKYLGNTVDTRTYDDGGRLATSVYLNGAETTWNYRQSGANKDNLLASIVTTNPGSHKVGTYSYTWDANKNKTAETITGSAINGRGFSTGSTGYDAEDRLTAWNRSDSNQNQAWNLSLVGDWNTFNQTGSSPLTQTRTHGPAHEFTSFTGTNSGTLTYDAKGNQTVRPASLAAPALNLVWDFDNRLIGADTDGNPATLEVTYEFDALGRRVARNGPSGNVVYVQSGQQTIADYARGTVASSPSFRYVYGSYIDEPILRLQGLATTLPTTGTHLAYYHRNQQYSIVALTNHSGVILERYAYTAHGELTIMAANGTLRTTSSYNNRYTYTGREYDPDLNLYHFRARMYDPIAGRFITRDPLGYVDGMGVYRAYFALRSVDPWGLKAWTTKVVGKSFIANIDKFGGIGTDPSTFVNIHGNLGEAIGQEYVPGTDISIVIPYPSDWLRGVASDWLFNLKENPRNDAKDGKYRLYSRLSVDFECCGGKLKIDPTKPRVELDGGAEISIPGHFRFGSDVFGLPITGVPVWVPAKPIVSGTVDMDKFEYDYLSESTIRFSYRVFGRPNILAEPSFQIVKSRTSKYIWHHVEVVVSCVGNKGTHSAQFIDVSGFPSHRLWVNGNQVDEKMQGPLSLLWKSKTDEPEFVIGRSN